jgi:hypothetical protein
MGAIAGDSPPGEPQLQKKFRTASSQLCTRTCLCLDLLGKRLSWHSSTARASHQCGLCCSFGTEARCSFIPPKESSECTMLFVFGVPMEFRDPLGTSSPEHPAKGVFRVYDIVRVWSSDGVPGPPWDQLPGSSECTILFVFGVPMEFRDPLGTSSPEQIPRKSIPPRPHLRCGR